MGADMMYAEEGRILRDGRKWEFALLSLWPHLTGHCLEGATPECFENMRAIVSAAVPGLPYAPDTDGSQ